MTPRTMRIVGIAAAIALLSACATSLSPTGSPSPSPSNPSVEGSWAINLTVSGGSLLPKGSQLAGSMTLNVDSGTGAIGGTLTLANGITGAITGTESGQDFTLSTNETAPCHSGTFDTTDGLADVGYLQLTGTFDGRDCNGKLSASLIAMRQ